MESIRLEVMAGDVPDGGWRLVAGRAHNPGEPKSATQAQLTLYGEWAETARTSLDSKKELTAFLLTKLVAH